MVDYSPRDLAIVQKFVDVYRELPRILTTGFFGFPSGEVPTDIGELVNKGIILRESSSTPGFPDLFRLADNTFSDIPRLNQEGKIIFR